MLKQTHRQMAIAEAKKLKALKCVVWDLDNTVWEGVLLEGDTLKLRPEVVHIIKTLDERGILNAVASRNEYEPAMAQLKAFGIDEYFIYPQISWNPKSQSIEQIAADINIGINTLAFVDDQPFEREEVQFTHPDVLCFDAAELDEMLDHPRLKPRFITPESRLRRKMYQSDIQRKQAEENFTDNNEAFLANLDMVFTIKKAGEEDLQRAEELTKRTNQLNTTGYTYSYEELNKLRQSDDHLLFVSSLDDRYGTYGTIGLALVEKEATFWTVKLLLMSCRVMSRGVGTIMMTHIMNLAKEAGVPLRAHFIPNGRNRLMYITYKFGGFTEIENKDNLVIFENPLQEIQPFPDYVDIHII
jgi:FkbH-like protein